MALPLVPLLKFGMTQLVGQKGGAFFDENGGQNVLPTKGLLTSKTTLGIIIALLGWATKQWGLGLDDAAIAATAGDIMTVGGSLLAIYGRYKATGSLGWGK